MVPHIVFDFFQRDIKSSVKTRTEVGGCVYRSLQDRKRCRKRHHLAIFGYTVVDHKRALLKMPLKSGSYRGGVAHLSIDILHA